MGWMTQESEFDSQESKYFSLFTWLRNPPSFLSSGYRRPFLSGVVGLKRPRSETDHSFPPSSDFYKEWIYT
jgi:hypothetical protein